MKVLPIVITVLLLKCSCGQVGQGVPDIHEPLSVCELLKNRLRFNGHMVAVRGLVEGGHGSWLVGDKCPALVVSGGFTWPSAVAITIPKESVEGHKGMHFNVKAYQDLKQSMERQGIGPNDRVLLTFVGVFETRDPIERYVITARNGERYGFGFGQLNYAPSQLLVTTVGEPAIQRVQGIFGPENQK